MKADALSHLEVLKKFRIVVRAAQRHSAWIEKQCGIGGAQLWVMQEVHDAPGARVGEIAHKLAIHQTTMSNLLNGLVKRGYIVKTRDTHDQRVVKLDLSDKGGSCSPRLPSLPGVCSRRLCCRWTQLPWRSWIRDCRV